MYQGIFYLQTFVASVQYLVNGILGQLVDRRLQICIIPFEQGIDLPEYHAVLILSQGSNRPFVDREGTVGNHFVHIYQIDVTQSLATRARTLRRIEREIMRSRLLVRKSRDGTHQPLAVMAYVFGLRIEYHQQPVTLLHRRSHALFQAFFLFVRHHGLIDNHLDIMVLITVQLHAMHDFLHLSVDPHIQVTFLPHLFEKFFIMPLPSTHQRCQDINPFSFIVAPDKVENLFFGILHHLFARQIRIGYSGTRKEQTQVVVNLGSGTYGRTRILIRGFLLNGDHRTQPRNLIHIGPLHSSQEIAGICRKGFDVTTLSLGKDSVKSQR